MGVYISGVFWTGVWGFFWDFLKINIWSGCRTAKKSASKLVGHTKGKKTGTVRRVLAAPLFRILGWTVARLNELINGKRGVTADSALDLAEELGTSPEVWLNLQMYFDLKRAERRRQRAS